MAQFDRRAGAKDSVCKLPVQNDGLAKSWNTLRTVPDAPNPFVASQNGASVLQSTAPVPHTEQHASR